MFTYYNIYIGLFVELAVNDIICYLNSGAKAKVLTCYLDFEEIESLGKPKRQFYTVNGGRITSYINLLQTVKFNLFGKGVLITLLI